MLQKYHNVQVTAEVTPASVDNLKLVHDQPKEIIAFSLADTAFDALQGRERFSDTGPIQVRSLGVLYANFTHLVAADGSGITTPGDLRGKRVSVGAAGSGTETIANRVLDAYGINPASDLQRERLGAAESAGALKDRRLDAFFWSGGLPTGAVTDLATTPGLSMRHVHDDDPQSESVSHRFPRDERRGWLLSLSSEFWVQPAIQHRAPNATGITICFCMLPPPAPGTTKTPSSRPAKATLTDGRRAVPACPELSRLQGPSGT
jgi:hypothetical protein